MSNDLESLTIHGFNRLCLANWKSAKVFWLFVVVFGFFAAISAVYTRINEHLQYNVTQSVTRNVHQSLPFPVITMCNGLRAQGQQNISLFSTGFERYASQHKRFCRFGDRYCYQLPLVYKAASPPLDHSCLVFNSDQKAIQTELWPWSGLTIDFFLNSTDIVSHKDHVLDEFDPQIAALKIFIHDSGTPTLTTDHKILAKPGHITTLVIEKVTVKRLPEPFPSKCNSKDDRIDLSPGDYTLLGCILSNWHIKAFLKCGYVNKKWIDLLPYAGHENVTFNATCFSQLSKDGYGNKYSCKLPCEETLYKVKSFSESKWPLGPELIRFKDIVNETLGIVPDDSFVYSNLGRIVIRFDAFYEIRYEEQPQSSLRSLSSDIGGSLGIALGASAISMLELVTIALTYIISRIKKQRTFSGDDEMSEGNPGERSVEHTV